MRAERFGSYSIARTVAGTPTLSRRKSMTRYRRLWPPPRYRTVMRPRLLRPTDLGSGVTSDGSGRDAVTSLKSKPVRKRRPGDVGRNWMIGMDPSSGSLEEVDATALGERHIRLLPVGTAPEMLPHAPDLAELAVRPDLGDLHLEEDLDGLADLHLVRARMHAEHDLVPQLVHQRALLGDDRALDDVGGVHALSPPGSAAPSPSRAATCSMASRVMTRCTCPSTS